MLPILVVGGVIGAVVSAIQGASWISDQVGPSNAASAGGKSAPKSSAEAKTSPFETALAAQAAGQTLPTTPATMTQAIAPTAAPALANVAVPAIASTAAAASLLPATHGTDYDALARMKAGITAYSHVGEHRANHPGATKPKGTEAGGSVSPS